MAAPTKYATPLEQLIELATESIRGRADDGTPRIPFEDFWARAVRPGLAIVMVTTPNPPPDCIKWPTDRNDRVTWQGAIEDARDGIQRAYERGPETSHERGLMFLAPVFDVLRQVTEEQEYDEMTDLMAA